MSLGVNILKNLAKMASLNLADLSDIEITDQLLDRINQI